MKLINRILYRSTHYPSNLNLSATETFHHKDLIKKIPSHRQKPTIDPKKLSFGSVAADLMVTINSKDNKWSPPVISPFKMLDMHPFNSTFHYGVQCYEGLKAYKNEKGQIRLFRPECNMARFKRSSTRASLPDFDGSQLLKILQDYVRLQSQYVPPFKGFSLYLRPFHISNQNSLGVKSPNSSQILIVSSPVGPYYPTGFNPISLFCDTKNIRSAPGGTGGYKLGGNYGPTIMLGNQASKNGHSQVLWLYDGKVGEVGSSNIFFVLTDKKTNKKKVITPKTEDLVLPGITRDSIIQLLRYQGVQVEQKVIMIDQIVQKLQAGELTQIFGAGTAVIVSPVKGIEYKGKSYNLKLNDEYKSGQLTYRIFNDMLDIQQGRKPNPFGWVRVIQQ